ncbi:MAG TPA: Ldh family oxidoreductase [Jatrophihabitantaceae bacterium]
MRGPTVAQGRAVARELLAASGVEPLAAAQTAHALVLADAWGVHSHGLLRLPDYLLRLQGGGCNAAAELRPVADTGALVTFDGENGLGHWQLWRAAELARDRCADHGVATVAVGRSSHCGALGVYTLPLVEAGLVGLVFSHGPAVMPPWNGTSAVVSTSPLAAGIPTHPEPAIVDLATSAVARGRIKVHAQRGEPLPEGWAFTADGEPTTDARAALDGMLAPLGGAKGFALAFLVEALTAGLVGPVLSTDVVDMFNPADAGRPQQIAHLVLALDPARLDVDGKGSGDRLDRLAETVVGAGGRLPGASRSSRLDEQALLGVSEQTWTAVGEWASRLGVAIG